jgi:NAD(P)-dependent dehydrogenase (short-subunit alcohol dehydrogenase family)
VAGVSDKRAVLITGASTGIGRACALGLDREGWHVFAGVRRIEDGEALRASASDTLTPVIVDVTDQATIDSAAAQVVDAAQGGLAGLVNNAGIPAGGPLEFLPIDEIRHAMEVNFFGQIAVTQAMLPAIRRATGRIVNISSIGGRSAAGLLGPYVASKHAIEAFTTSLRQELRPWGIWVAAIEPGAIKTEIWRKGETVTSEVAASLPDEATELYQPAFARIARWSERSARIGASPERVFRSVRHALTARRPRAHYLVGIDARMQLMLQTVLPARANDALVERLLGV